MLSVVLSPDTEKMHHDSSKISLRIQPPGLNDEATSSIATEQTVDLTYYRLKLNFLLAVLLA